MTSSESLFIDGLFLPPHSSALTRLASEMNDQLCAIIVEESNGKVYSLKVSLKSLRSSQLPKMRALIKEKGKKQHGKSLKKRQKAETVKSYYFPQLLCNLLQPLLPNWGDWALRQQGINRKETGWQTNRQSILVALAVITAI